MIWLCAFNKEWRNSNNYLILGTRRSQVFVHFIYLLSWIFRLHIFDSKVSGGLLVPDEFVSKLPPILREPKAATCFGIQFDGHKMVPGF